MNWKPEKMGEHFPAGKKSGNFEQTEKSQRILHKKDWKKYWKSWDIYTI